MGEAPRVRTCVGCRAARDQRELLRLARTPDGVRFDPDRRLPGRGAYLCPDPRCVEIATSRRAGALRRALRVTGEAEVGAAMDALRTEVVRHRVPDGTVRSENA